MSQTQNIQERIQQMVKQTQRAITNTLPRKVAVIAKNHFTDNFRHSGFVDGGLQPWQKAKRESSKSPNARYKTLTSMRNHLMRSIYATPSPAKVTITNPVPYAKIHNQGGTINTHPKVTPQMRKMAWAKFFELTGQKKSTTKNSPKGAKKKLQKASIVIPPEAKKWKNLALTKKNRLNISAYIPKRPFIGQSKELSQKIEQTITNTIKEITQWKN